MSKNVESQALSTSILKPMWKCIFILVVPRTDVESMSKFINLSITTSIKFTTDIERHLKKKLYDYNLT